MSYDNYLKEICDTDKSWEWNFVFVKSGPTNTHSKYQLTPHSIKPDIHRIKMWYETDLSLLKGL